MGLFSKSPTKSPKDHVNEWCSKLRKEGNQLERQIRSIQREEEKVKRSLKEAAKKGDKETCRILAIEIVRSNKAITRIYTSKAHLNSIQCQMKSQLATLRVAGSLQKSTETMKAMQQLIKIPELNRIMQEMSKEMMKAGILEEMMEDTMDTMEPEEMEEETAEEVDKILYELTAGQIGAAPQAGQDTLPPIEPEKEEDEEEEKEDMEEMRHRLEALRS